MPEFEPTRFYDDLANDYDGMTGFLDRFKQEEPVYRSFVERFGISTAVDAGCGTGLLSLLLARMGVRVTGSDYLMGNAQHCAPACSRDGTATGLCGSRV